MSTVAQRASVPTSSTLQSIRGGPLVPFASRLRVAKAHHVVTAAAVPSRVPEPLQFDLPSQLPLQLLSVDDFAQEVDGGVCAPCGFRAQGVFAGLRSDSTRADLAVIESLPDAAVATAQPPKGGAARTARVVVIAAGQLGDAGAVSAAAADALSLPADSVLLVSTGPGSTSSSGEGALRSALLALPKLAVRLEATPEGAHHAACALTTTADTTCKTASMEISLGKWRSVRLGGMAHGDARGLQALVTCDAPVDPELWQAMFTRATASSFQQLALVHTPTDSVVGLANGAAGGEVLVDEESEEAMLLEAALTDLMQGLAKEVAWDAVGARCLIEVVVTGAPSMEEAGAVALAVAGCPHVRTAVQAGAPNWRVIADAARRSGVEVADSSLRVAIGGMPLLHHGHPSALENSAASYCTEYLLAQIGRRGEVRVQVEVGEGLGQGRAWGSGAA